MLPLTVLLWLILEKAGLSALFFKVSIFVLGTWRVVQGDVCGFVEHYTVHTGSLHVHFWHQVKALGRIVFDILRQELKLSGKRESELAFVILSWICFML